MKIKQINLNKGYGTCPYCDGINYSREDIDPSNDIIIANCYCDDCHKGFKEYFYLTEQHYEVD